MPNPEAFVPLKPLAMHVLVALIAGPRHGYAIVKEVSRQTDGILTVEPGNLYRTIRTLRQQHLLAESSPPPEQRSDDERRRYFSLTRLGERVIRLEAARLEEVAALARSRLAETEAP